MRKIKKIIIHCSATKPDVDIGTSEIRGWHVKDNGWSDIGYHAVVCLNGTVQNGRPLEKAGAHVRGQNADSIGICLIGGINESGEPFNTFNTEQFIALSNLLDEYISEYGINRKNVFGHNELSNKNCPCFNVREWMRS